MGCNTCQEKQKGIRDLEINNIQCELRNNNIITLYTWNTPHLTKQGETTKSIIFLNQSTTIRITSDSLTKNIYLRTACALPKFVSYISLVSDPFSYFFSPQNPYKVAKIHTTVISTPAHKTWATYSFLIVFIIFQTLSLVCK